MLPCQIQQPQRSCGVDFVVLLRRVNRVAHPQTSKMIDQVYTAHECVHASRVPDVFNMQRDRRTENTFQILTSTAGQIIDDEDLRTVVG